MLNALFVPHLRAHRRFLAFAAVGTLGFAVDAAALYLLLHFFDAGLYGGRFLSFVCAATTTWYFNRIWTFCDCGRSNFIAQWMSFLATNSIGGVVNFATYAVLLELVPHHPIAPLVAVAGGSIAGLVFNYSLSRLLIFRKSDQ